MALQVAVVDYGIGNLFSVRRALEHCGADVTISEDPATLLDAPRLILPGVGAFANGMQGLAERGLDEVVLEFARLGKPLLGVCLGMQMLMDVSHEFGRHSGLGIISGQVNEIPAIEDPAAKVPNVGWVELERPDGLASWDGAILEGLETGDAVYIVHSFAVTPEDPAHRLANYDYFGIKVSAAIRSGHVYGTQFHPEKSGLIGLRILANFLTCGEGNS